MKQWIALSFSFLLFCGQGICSTDEFLNPPNLVVKGEASIFKPADQMEVSLGVVTEADTSSQALNENNLHIRQILANLKELGLDDSDYQTGHFHIKPIYQKPAKNNGENNRGTISRYEVLNAIQIKTQKIALAEKILTAAVQGGANQITQANFSLNNPQSYREEAIKLASQNALADASALADATGVKLKRIIQISLDHWYNFPSPVMLGKRGVAHPNMSIPEVIEAGQTEIHAVVNITFEIGPG